MLFADSASHLKEYQIIVIKALQNIGVGEELYIKYNSVYNFPSF